jgi:Mg2+ and Co2+ transporter CorA
MVPSNWQLPDAFRQRLGSSVGRQRMMQHDGHLLIVAHEVPRTGERNRKGLLFWRDAEGTWRASNGEAGGAAIGSLVSRYEKTIDEFEKMEAGADKAVEYFPLLDGLSPMQRAARNFHSVLVDARKAFPEVRELIDLRDEAYEMSRAAELLYQDTKNSMDIAVVRQSEEQAITSNRMSIAAHRLNIMAAVFFPLATLGGIFGTTLTDGWSWSDSPAPFLLFVTVGLITGVLLAIIISRKS